MALSLEIIGKPSKAPWDGGLAGDCAPCPSLATTLEPLPLGRVDVPPECLFCATAEVASVVRAGTRIGLRPLARPCACLISDASSALLFTTPAPHLHLHCIPLKSCVFATLFTRSA